MATDPPTSSRFRRAAAAERTRLLRHRDKLASEVRRLQAQLADKRKALQSLEDEVDSLARLAGGTEPPASEPSRIQESEPGQLLRGADIRETAVRVLACSDQGRAPIHYRQWLELVENAGYRIAGRRADAVFLNQVTRSPVVRSTTKAGVYELDYEVPSRLRRELSDLRGELNALAQREASAEGLIEASARHDELTSKIRRARKALEETERGLQADQTSADRLAA